ncbi:MAG: hypothetical protein JWN04_2593, partial [Myxococcaceae bacterium]|nr:hypothetical protein [Myxococcaceae bacterium]
LWGKGCLGSGAPALWPWLEILRTLLAPLGGVEGVRARLGQRFDAVFQLLPEFENESPAPSAEDFERSSTELAHARFRLFDALTRLLCLLCGRTAEGLHESSPAFRVIVLEDLHACDDGSLQLLSLARQKLCGLGLLLVGTYHDLELAEHGALAALVGDRQHAVPHVQLGPLSEPDLRVLMQQCAGAPVSARWISFIHQLSSGNPLLVHELLRQVRVDEVGLSGEPPELFALAFPARIGAVVRRCLQRLPAATCNALASAATVGPEFSLAALSQLLGGSEASSLALLGPALARDLVRSSSTKPQHFVFSHAVVHSAVYHGIPAALRAELHRAVGEFLECSPRSSLQELAHHFMFAATGGALEKAVMYARAAADQAYDARHFELAATLYDRALELSGSESAGDGAAYEQLMRAGDAWYQAGERELACKRFDRAEALAHRGQDKLGRAWAVARWISASRTSLLLDGSIQQRLRDTFEREAIEQGPVGAMLLSFRAMASTSSSSSERDAASLRAVDHARGCGDAAVLRWTLRARHLALSGFAPPTTLAAIACELVEHSRQVQDSELLLDWLLHHMLDSLMAGDLPAVMRDRSEHVAITARAGSPFHRYMVVACDAAEATMAGSFASGALFSARAAELGARLDPSAELNHALRTLFSFVHYGFGEGAVAEWPFEDIPPEYRPFWSLAWVHGERVESAKRVLSGASAAGLLRSVNPLLRRALWAVLAELSVQLGELELAREVYPLLLPEAGSHLALHAGVYLGPVSYYLALIAAADGRRVSAESHFHDAFGEALSVGALPFLARMRHAYGQWLERDTSSARRAPEVLLAATHLARGLGMTLAR